MKLSQLKLVVIFLIPIPVFFIFRSYLQSTGTEEDAYLIVLHPIAFRHHEYLSDGLIRLSAKVKNSGTGVAVISDVVSGCGCTEAQISSSQIPPGGTSDLLFLINPSIAPERSVDLDIQKGTFKIRGSCRILGNFRTSEEQGVLAVDVTQHFLLPATFTHPVLDLGSIPEAGEEIEFRFDFKTRSGVKIQDIECQLDGIDVTYNPIHSDVSLKVGEAYQLILTIMPQRNKLQTAQQQLRFVRLVFSCPPHKRTTTMNVPLLYRVEPPISLSPARLIVGPVFSGEITERIVSLTPDRIIVSKILGISVLKQIPGIEAIHRVNSEGVDELELTITSLKQGVQNIELPVRIETLGAKDSIEMGIPLTLIVKGPAN